MIDPAIIVDAIVLSGLAGIGAGAFVLAVSRRGKPPSWPLPTGTWARLGRAGRPLGAIR